MSSSSFFSVPFSNALIDSLKNLPGIGSKTAERLAFSMIDFDKDKLTAFSEAICGVRDKVSRCNVCGNISDGDVCSICLNCDREIKGYIFI